MSFDNFAKFGDLFQRVPYYGSAYGDRLEREEREKKYGKQVVVNVNINSTPTNESFGRPVREDIESPRTYNQKIFKLAKELRERELKVQVLKNFLNFENVYDKANSAIEDRYIVGDIFQIAKDIKHFKETMINDEQIIKQIVLFYDLNDSLDDVKDEYLKYVI